MYASDFCMCENNTKMKKEAEFLPDSRAFFPNFLLCGSGIRIQLGFGSKTLKHCGQASETKGLIMNMSH